MQRTVNMPNEEPEQKRFELPSENVEHLFQVVDLIDSPDPDIAIAKIEIAEGDEIGRSLLHRVNMDSEWKGFFLTRLFLKAIGEPYKGDDVVIDPDNWPGRQFYSSVIHNKGTSGKIYANIDQYNFEKAVEQVETAAQPAKEQVAGWDDDK